MSNSTVYPNVLHNPRLTPTIVRLTDPNLTGLERHIIAEELADAGYVQLAAAVRENRVGPAQNIPDVKFANDVDNDRTEGIDTSFGHRFTIMPDWQAGDYVLYDRKHGRKLRGPNPLVLKGAALRAAGNETDPSSQQRTTGAVAYKNEPTSEVVPLHEFPEPPTDERLASLFPGHFMNQ